jgi:hypothetical protein
MLPPIRCTQNNEWEWGYRENEPLDGFDPYSNSKSCSELVTHSYVNSFFSESGVELSARLGQEMLLVAVILPMIELFQIA